MLGSQTDPVPLIMKFSANETKAVFDLGELVYKGDPADELSVSFLEDKKVPFAKIIEFNGGTY